MSIKKLVGYIDSRSVSTKLMLIGTFFVIPELLMLYLFINSINASIRFNQLEKMGNEYQRPLAELLSLIPQHQYLAEKFIRGDRGVEELLNQKRIQIDQQFAQHNEVDKRIGLSLQFTSEGLHKRNRKHIDDNTVPREWDDLKNHLPALSEDDLRERHLHLINDLRVMITHLGDNSNLILDPDLDSYYLMDVTLLAMPQTQTRLRTIMAYGQRVITQKTISVSEKLQVNSYVTMLEQADMDRVIRSATTALIEDQNFYGISTSLHQNLPPALEEYKVATERFIKMTKQMLSPTLVDLTPEEYFTAGQKASDECIELWRIAVDELDTLLQKRIDYYLRKRAIGLGTGVIGLLSAVGLVVFITRSISLPLQKQAAELSQANLILQDEIKARKNVEEKLRENQRVLATLFNNIPGIVYRCQNDSNWTMTLVSDGCYTITGYHRTELEDNKVVSYRSLVHPEDSRWLWRKCADHLQFHQYCDNEYRIVTKSGEVRWVWDRAEGIYSLNDQLIGIEGFVTDITDRKKAESERAALEIDLRHAQKLESIGRLAAGIAHEINTPTQYISDNTRFFQDSFVDIKLSLQKYRNLLEAAKDSSVTPELIAEVESTVTSSDLEYLLEEIPNALRQSTEGIGRVAKIVQAMKEFSHPGAGEEKTLVDLNHAIESTLIVSRSEWKYVADLVTDFDKALPMVLCLPNELNQVILNLIVNASHAITDRFGHDGADKGTITVSTRYRETQAEIRIADTGNGVPEAVRNKIFEPFFTTKGVGKGTGQGLAIARSVVVDKHGGTINFETELGKGTTFVISLPIGTNGHDLFKESGEKAHSLC